MTGFGLTGGASSKNEALLAGAWGAQRSVIVHPRHIAVITLRVCARDWRPTDRGTRDRSGGDQFANHVAPLQRHRRASPSITIVSWPTRRGGRGGQAGRLNTVVA